MLLQDTIKEDVSLYAANGISSDWLEIVRQMLASGLQL